MIKLVNEGKKGGDLDEIFGLKGWGKLEESGENRVKELEPVT